MNVLLSLAFYAGALLVVAGLVSIVRPVRMLGIRNRGLAVLVLVAAVGLVAWSLTRPALAYYVTEPDERIDTFAPVYQFKESYSIPVHARARKVLDAVSRVTADEIPLYRTLVWLRRGGVKGPESILNPPDGVPLVTVATRTTFIKLAEVPGRELVLGAVVLAPPGVRLAVASTPESFQALSLPGFAKAVINFSVHPLGDHWTLVRTETRVFVTDPESRDLFARYWRVILPGSALIRNMWLRAVKTRAEALGG
ncbi:MAG: hypothetical protein AB1806_05135 [Acidobacteriota bacterium]